MKKHGWSAGNLSPFSVLTKHLQKKNAYCLEKADFGMKQEIQLQWTPII